MLVFLLVGGGGVFVLLGGFGLVVGVFGGKRLFALLDAVFQRNFCRLYLIGSVVLFHPLSRHKQFFDVLKHQKSTPKIFSL